MKRRAGKHNYPLIEVERIGWWHGDAWPIILAYQGNRPIYRTARPAGETPRAGPTYDGYLPVRSGYSHHTCV
ncbi:MAG: hypothetical protein ACLFR8_00495 [Alkalispirochaeta sp.]